MRDARARVWGESGDEKLISDGGQSQKDWELFMKDLHEVFNVNLIWCLELMESSPRPILQRWAASDSRRYQIFRTESSREMTERWPHQKSSFSQHRAMVM